MIGPLALRTRTAALVGLVVLGVVGLGLVQGSLTVADAALRVGLAVVALVAAERVLLPLAVALVGQRR